MHIKANVTIWQKIRLDLLLFYCFLKKRKILIIILFQFQNYPNLFYSKNHFMVLFNLSLENLILICLVFKFITYLKFLSLIDLTFLKIYFIFYFIFRFENPLPIIFLQYFPHTSFSWIYFVILKFFFFVQILASFYLFSN